MSPAASHLSRSACRRNAADGNVGHGCGNATQGRAARAAARLALALLPLAACAAHGQTDRNMYDPEYYPTPEPVIQRMLAPYVRKSDVGRYDASALAGLTILDPSAGSGALLKYVAELCHGMSDPPTLHAVEINEDMQPTLRERFTLVHDDFLTFQPEVRYDLVLMNPPFSNGDAHLEHAWNMLQQGDIVCLLNAETLRNPHTVRRKHLATLVAEHGELEHLGPAFKASQRPTEVDVVLVRLRKRDTHDRFSFWEDEHFAPQEEDFRFTEEALGNLPAVNDRIAAMVRQYQASQEAYVDYMKAHKRLLYHAGPLVDRVSQLTELVHESLKQDTGKASFHRFVNGLQQYAWEGIFQRTKLNDLMTEGVRKDFEAMRRQQGGMPFTEANIHGLLQLLFANRHTILQKCVEEAFDLMTRYSAGNTSHYEGWRTNDAHKVNRKVIIPDWAIKYDREWGTWSTGYGTSHYKWQDIDRAMAMLEGRKLSSPTRMQAPKDERPYRNKGERTLVTIIDAVELRFWQLNENTRRGVRYRHYQDNVCESEYFHIKFWKKGTMHLVFKDERLWQQFNQQAALGKQWLPHDKDHVPTPKSDPADRRYAERLAEVNAENAKLLLEA